MASPMPSRRRTAVSALARLSGAPRSSGSTELVISDQLVEADRSRAAQVDTQAIGGGVVVTAQRSEGCGVLRCDPEVTVHEQPVLCDQLGSERLPRSDRADADRVEEHVVELIGASWARCRRLEHLFESLRDR